MNPTTKFLACALLGFIGLSSCTKTEITPYEEEPAKLISSYKIVNTSNELKGMVNEKEKTITVVIPYGEYYNSLEPEITLASGNTLKADADTLITDVFDYFVNGRDILYPITDQQGKTTTFKLIINTLQPTLEFEEISTSASSPKIFDMSNTSIINTNLGFQIYNTNLLYPYSGNTELNNDLTMGTALIAEDGTEYKFKTAGASPRPGYININLGYIEGYIVPGSSPPIYTMTPPAGLYRLKVRFYNRETTLQYPIRIIYSKPL
ncbi:hypothetical protein [Sphingobacterium pedocola]|uniref:DUF1735 domain-containing protein n=1 Tax=Sphingobacterium pedocola TaxID=2082722 RepID=A0ABR9T7J7_9SPHI|nr:hypothetical protein [Sphingobacterium pedocola]MBE8721298.1 hypothetical protein [Sphingobacterium pedocola]